MALEADSYSNVTSVVTMTRNILGGQTTFNSTTRPTLTEVEGFIDEASDVLNIALRSAGFTPSAVRANSTAKKVCDSWVRLQTVTYVEMTKPYVGFDGNTERPNMARFLKELPGSAVSLTQSPLMLGFKREGVAVADPAHQGLRFTGLDAQSERPDPENDSLAQPMFKRNLFDAP